MTKKNKERVFDIQLPSGAIADFWVRPLGKALLYEGYDLLTFTANTTIGAYLTIDLRKDL